MNVLLQPWQLLVVIFAGWVNRHQQEVIEFQRAEIQVLLEQIGRKRILLSDDSSAEFTNHLGSVVVAESRFAVVRVL